MSTYPFIATTSRGLERVLEQELRPLGASHIRRLSGAVSFDGPLELAIRANLWLRTAQRLLMPIARYPSASFDALYEGAAEVPWRDHFSRHHSIAVSVVLGETSLSHSQFAAQRVKDAVVDQMRERGGRPSVNLADPDVRIQAFVHRGECQLSLDLSGEPLFKRGYRVEQTEAPLKETLAAGIVALTGWDGECPLLDPMCGSGTLLIEALERRLNLAPGRRRTFALERLPRFAGSLPYLRELREEVRHARPSWSGLEITASDISPIALEAARANARAAGLEPLIHFQVADVRALSEADLEASLLSNPPYGKRLRSEDAAVHVLYRAIGARIRNRLRYPAHFFCAHPVFESALGLSASSRIPLFNGPLETWLYRFEPRRASRPASRAAGSR